MLASHVAKMAWSCTEQIYDLVSRNRRQTNGVPILSQECKDIQQMAELVIAIVAGLEFAQMNSPKLWKDTYEALHACCQPLFELQVLLKDLRRPRGTSTRNLNAVRANRRKVEQSNIYMMQAEMNQYMSNLNRVTGQFSLLLLSKPGRLPPP